MDIKKDNQMYMQVAMLASERSYAKRLKVGCVIVKNNSIISIGWNGTGFATSTDWKIQTPRVRCILPPAVVPQYQTFVTMKAGMNIDYSLHQKGWQMTRDEKDAVILFPDGEKVFIKNGEAIEVKIQPGCSKFILSDCEVIEEECSDKRIFKIIENDHTQYGKYDEDVIFLL